MKETCNHQPPVRPKSICQTLISHKETPPLQAHVTVMLHLRRRLAAAHVELKLQR